MGHTVLLAEIVAPEIAEISSGIPPSLTAACPREREGPWPLQPPIPSPDPAGHAPPPARHSRCGHPAPHLPPARAAPRRQCLRVGLREPTASRSPAACLPPGRTGGRR